MIALALALTMTNINPAVRADAAPESAAFAFRLLRAAEDSAPGKNVLISPYSVSRALGLAYVGSEGTTRKAFADVLGVPPPAQYAAQERKSLAGLAAAAPGEGTLAIANSLWLNADWKFHAAYVKTATEDLGAGAFRRAFDAKTLAEINAWTGKATHGRIPKILDKLGERVVAVLVNAVYFKGAWETPFPRERTQSADFHPLAGPAFKHPLMERGGMFAYAERDGLQVVSLPYGENNIQEMVVALPAPGKPLPALDAASWSALLADRQHRRGTVRLPRFKFEFSAELADVLAALGLGVAFDPAKADFSAMAPARTPDDRLSISRVVHKTFIAVDEAGTEAAAATAVSMRAGGMPPRDEPFEFTADRPFLFAIVDSRLPEPLFLGAVQDPR